MFEMLLYDVLFYFILCRNYFGNINFFGGPSTVAVKSSAKLRAIEEENQEAMFVILSDVWLDLPKVSLQIYSLYNQNFLSIFNLYFLSRLWTS